MRGWRFGAISLLNACTTNTSMHLPVQCYMMGIYSGCLSTWEKPIGEMEGLFHEVKIIHTTIGQKKKGKRISHFSMAKRPPLDGTRTRGIGLKVVAFLTIKRYISKQCIFCLPNASESVKHKFWDCIQARRAWRWAMFIMHELCGVKTGNYDSFH